MNNLIDIFQRIGAGMAASNQGEFLHGWLPAMALRPSAPTHDTGHGGHSDGHVIRPMLAKCNDHSVAC